MPESQMKREIQERRAPLICNLELTYRCNLRCRHCYVSIPQKTGELSAAEVMKILDKIVAAGCLRIRLTGGEPLLRDDFSRIYEYAVKKGMAVTVLTNGTLITPRIAGVFAKVPPFSIEVSVYGASAETYRKFCGSARAYRDGRKGLEFLYARGLPFEIKTTVTRINKGDFDRIEAMARAYRCYFRYDATLYPRRDGSWFGAGLALSPQEVVDFDLGACSSRQRVASWRDLYFRYKGKSRPPGLYTCDAGLISFSVDPAGRMNLCHMLAGRPAYNLLRGSFKAGLALLRKERARRLSAGSPCRHCSVYFLCNKCHAMPGGGARVSAYYCRIAGLRRSVLEKGN